MPRTSLAGLSASLLSALLVAGSACTGELPPAEPGAPSGDRSGALAGAAWQGELVVHMLDFEDHAELKHFLRAPDGSSRELRFSQPAPELASGTSLRVTGELDGETLVVRRFEVLDPPAPAGGLERRASSLINATKKRPKRWAFILVDIGAGVRLTKAEAERRLFSEDPTSVSSYFREVSYGMQELSGDVLGPFKTTAAAAGLCQNFGTAVNELGPMIPGTYDQYLWFFGSRISGCPWAGIAQLGTADRSTKHSAYNGIAECVVLVQEPGHNFGMVHSSAIRCSRGGAAVSMVAAGDGGSCTHDEYGSPFDPMGGGTVGSAQELNRCYHMNAVQKAYQGWLGGCNIVTAETSGIYTLYPLEQACNGAQMLSVPLPAPRVLSFPASPGATLRSGTLTNYYVEYRVPVGLDARLQTPRVFVVGAGNLREGNTRGNPNWLIDMTPETRSVLDAQLAVGKTYSDPATNGPKITVLSADATKAVIQVQLNGGEASMAMGSGKCDDGMPFQAPGPSECAGAPAAPPTTPGSNAGIPPLPDAGMSSGGSGGAGGGTEPTPGTTPGTDASLPSAATDARGGPAAPGGGGTSTTSEPAVAGSCGCRVGGVVATGNAGPLLLVGLAGVMLFRRRRVHTARR